MNQQPSEIQRHALIGGQESGLASGPFCSPPLAASEKSVERSVRRLAEESRRLSA